MSSSRKAIFAALASNCLIAIAKFIAGAITGSSAIMSEGVHSVVDMGNEIFLLYGLRRSKMPADEEFPFGHGKELYFWSFIVAILIFAGGAGVSILKGLNHLSAPTPGKDFYVNYIMGLLQVDNMIFDLFKAAVAYTLRFSSGDTLHLVDRMPDAE